MTGEGSFRRASAKKATAVAAAFFAVMALMATAPELQAQTGGTQQVRIDSLEVVGNHRVTRESILSVFGIQSGKATNFREIQRGIKNLFRSEQFADITVRARGNPGEPVVLVVEVREQALLRRVSITGLEHASPKQVRDTTGLRPGAPYSPQRVLNAKALIRRELAAKGIPFAAIEERQEPVKGADNEIDLYLDVNEGRRVTVAQVVFRGNERVGRGDLIGAMSTKPEGFWWFRPGSYDAQRFDTDLTDGLPQLYRSRGFLDFQVRSDTVIVDPRTGKARLEVDVEEGPQYRLGDFTIEGNSQFTTEDLKKYFQKPEGGLLRSLGLGGGADRGKGQVFNQVAFNEAVQRVQEAYRNEGYLYVQINPVVSKHPPEDGRPATVDASWIINEGQPAFVNRVSIVGNDYTYEWVIRDRIFILPGDVYSQDRVLRSYQSISSLGFFETPMPPPDIQPQDNGDVNIIFHVKEKNTGSVNFGTSVGGGVGLSGFLGYEQPNLFGQAKSGRVRWDFGRFINAFELAYSDPALFQSVVSGSISLFNTRDRFFQFSTGRRRRIGTTLRFGFPVPNSRVTRLFLGYSISRTTYQLFSDVDDTSLFGRPPGTQSQLSVSLTRQTLDHPMFPTVGSRQNIDVQFNGGLLGGDGQFTKITSQGSWWLPVGSVGGSASGGQGIRFALGLTLRGGALFGNADAFPFDRFWMGGVQFGQPLRGYDETSITPLGFFPQRTRGISDIDRLGDAFFSLTAEYAMRLSDQISISLFYDAGNVWKDPTEFDPTRLFRGAGVGLQLVTPFGPLGLDYAYGFDKPQPGWQLHFRMGPNF